MGEKWTQIQTSQYRTGSDRLSVYGLTDNGGFTPTFLPVLFVFLCEQKRCGSQERIYVIIIYYHV